MVGAVRPVVSGMIVQRIHILVVKVVLLFLEVADLEQSVVKVVIVQQELRMVVVAEVAGNLQEVLIKMDVLAHKVLLKLLGNTKLLTNHYYA